MAGNTILTPGYNDPTPSQPQVTSLEEYLKIDNYLSEYLTESAKATVRANLDIPSTTSVYTKSEVDTNVAEAIRVALLNYLNMEDPHGILPEVETMIDGMIKEDGSIPFIAPQAGVDPIADNHLTTKKFVSRLLREHINAEDPHNILPEVADLLLDYAKASDVYTKNTVYTKNEVDLLNTKYVKLDGSTPFNKPLIGIDPQIDSHLATKRYIDKALYNHLVEVDPHNFLTILNNRLSSYIKKTDVYNKTQTYSRALIDGLVLSMVNDAISNSLDDYVASITEDLTTIKRSYIKQDGSVPFRNPQKGVAATADNELVTLGLVSELLTDVDAQIKNKECVWKTSGPVLTTVGFVEDDTVLAKEVTLLEIMDAIFYGKKIAIYAPKVAIIGDKVEVEVCVQGTTASLDYAELTLNGIVIASFTKANFDNNSCITVESLPINEDTEFEFTVFDVSGGKHEISTITKVGLPIFVGLLPKWKFGNEINFDYIQELVTQDPDNNEFIGDIDNVVHQYNFLDAELRHILLAIPTDYPDLYLMLTPSQLFGKDAFDIVDMIPFDVNGNTVIYKLYVYRQALALINIPVTFKFEQQ